MSSPAPAAPLSLSSADLRNALAVASDAVRAAGDLLLRLRRAPLDVVGDFAHDIKLQADRESEALILSRLAAFAPALPVLTEETGEHGIVDPAAPLWVVDPLDGTFNYSKGMPQCCSSIGLCIGGEPVLGAVYNFFTDELFTGLCLPSADGGGAWLNGVPIHASAVTNPPAASLATGFPHHFDLSSASMATFVRRVQSFKKIRMIGSAALMAAYVGTGWFDAYVESDIWLWDIAGAAAIARAAGATVRIGPGFAGTWARTIVCAATPALADALAIPETVRAPAPGAIP